jgi:hypothetical protein
MAGPTVLALRCPRCGAALSGSQQDVVFWCRECQVPHEVVGEGFVERRGSVAQAALRSEKALLHLPLWAFQVSYATRWEDPKQAALARHLPAVEWVYVTAFELHNASYFGDPGQIFTQKLVRLEAGAPAPIIGCTRSLEEAKAYVEPHLLTIIDLRVDVTGLELSCAISGALFWGVPYFDGGESLQDGILGLKIPAAAVDELGAIRARSGGGG